MGAFLIEHWLAGSERIAVVDDASISEVREAIRARCASIGLPTLAIERTVAAASELAHNQLAHASSGIIGLRAVERAGVMGFEVIAADRGRGIADPAVALRGTPRAEGSLGVGLSAAARQADEIDLDVRRGTGTCVRIRTFTQPVKRSEVGILAQPHPDESVIGDHATLVRDASGVTLAVADGLGHGLLARQAADRAIDEVVRQPRRALDDILVAAHAAVMGTRGAVMAIARIGDGLEHAGVGNIGSRVLGVDGTARPLGSIAGTLGSALSRRIPIEHVALGPGNVLVMFSDGLSSRLDLVHDPAKVRSHPIVIAQSLLERFVRGTDDALVAVVR